MNEKLAGYKDVGAVGEKGLEGTYGPNDTAYSNSCVIRAAECIKSAISFRCVGYGWGNAYVSEKHPFRIALTALKENDARHHRFSNRAHDESAFVSDRFADVLPPHDNPQFSAKPNWLDGIEP